MSPKGQPLEIAGAMFFYRLYTFPDTQPTVSMHRMHKPELITANRLLKQKIRTVCLKYL